LSIFVDVNAHHSIRVVSMRTGLSPHVIRVWERRYQAVEPERTGTKRRMYSDEELSRLQLLRAVTSRGHKIGDVARLPEDRLRVLAGEMGEAANGDGAMPATHPGAAHLGVCLAAVRALDARALDKGLGAAAAAFGSQGLLLNVVAPLAQEIGRLWLEGDITAAHEHFASSVIRTFLGQSLRTFAEPEGAPVLVVATPAGQLHELGALLVAAGAANLGWKVAYLGASLPAAEIAGAAIQKQARAVAISLVYPEDDPRLEGELARLRELLPAEMPVFAGGRATPAYAAALQRHQVREIEDLSGLWDVLDELRRSGRKGAR
jgi:methylmalonyl-CoA mutase cobalamin-binding subunit